MKEVLDIPVGTKALILSKLYYGVLSKNLESLDIERYYSVLHYLHYHNGASQQSICNKLAIDKTAMVKVIDYLIKADYVERKVNPADRREHFVTLSKKGIKQTELVVKAFEALDKELFHGILKEEKDNFLKTLHKLTINLSDLPSDDLFFNYTKTIHHK